MRITKAVPKQTQTVEQSHAARTRKRASVRTSRICEWCGTPLSDAANSRAKWCKQCDPKQARLPDDRKAGFLVMSVDGEGQTGKCQVRGCICPVFMADQDDLSLCICGHAKYAADRHGIAHEHIYVLLGVGSKQLWHKDGSELKWHEIFGCLWEQFTSNPKNTVYVGFWLGYDFINWLKYKCGMPWDRAAGLLMPTDKTYKSRHKPKQGPPLAMQINSPKDIPCPMEIRDGGDVWQWQFDILGNLKRFRLRLQPCGCRIVNCIHVKNMPWMFICDAASFFQGAFMDVINPRDWITPIVTDEEWEILKAGKDAREDATLDDDMRRYNLLENDVLSRVIAQLNEGFKAIGIHLARDEWFSPGQPASKWMKNRAPKYKNLRDTLPAGLLDNARDSYMAGWWHVSMVGHGPHITYLTDINSAYPDVYARLPCLGIEAKDGFESHGRWFYMDYAKDKWMGNHWMPARIREDMDVDIRAGELALVHAHVKGSDPYLGSMLHRNKEGRIARPNQTAGWYWYHELEPLKRLALSIIW